MIEVMNHIKVLLKPTERSEYILSQDDECVTAMNSIPPGEIMCRVHIADRSDKAPATKGIEAWKYFQDIQYQLYKKELINSTVELMVLGVNIDVKGAARSTKRKMNTRRVYNSLERVLAISRYRLKKMRRTGGVSSTRYISRQNFANSRERLKGRFTSIVA